MSASSNDRGDERTGGGGGGGGEAEPEEKTDGWLTTYADMVTLMLTFFVLLVAMASFDNENAELFMLAISQRGITADQFWEIKDKYNFEDLDLESWDDMWPLPGTESQEPDDRGGEAALQELHDAMSGYIDESDLGEVIRLSFNGDFLLMVLASDILFASGSAQMTPEMYESAEVIGGLIANTFEPNDPFEIVVAGHTDNVPINTPQYPSNWHLSRDRSVNFLYELIQHSDIDPGLFYARACGEYRPIASNETPEGRQLNRRVEVMVSLARDNPLWDRGIAEETPPVIEQTELEDTIDDTAVDTPPADTTADDASVG